MKYLDQVCGLRLKTAVKVIAIIGMVASLVGFSIAVNRMIQTSARHSNSTDAQTLASEEYLVGNQEEGTGGATGFHEEDTTVLPFVDVVGEGSNEENENVGLTEGLEEVSASGPGDVVSRSKRDVINTATTEKLVSGNTDSSVQVPPTSSGNVVPDYIDDDNEASQSSVTKRLSPVVTSTPKPELASSNTPPTTSSTTMSTTMKKTDAEEVTSTTEKPVEKIPDLPKSKEKGNNPASSEDESYQGDQQDQEEISEETEFEIIETIIEDDIDIQDSSANEDNLTDEHVGETNDDEVDSGSSRASQVVTGLGAPICLLGFLANAVLLHSAKKAEKKLLIFWLVWAVVLYMYQIFAMIVNLCDLSPYIFFNLMLFMLSAGAGYVVLSYRKQLTDPSSYSLKTVEMNGYALDKGYVELDNKGTSGTSAGGDNNV